MEDELDNTSLLGWGMVYPRRTLVAIRDRGSGRRGLELESDGGYGYDDGFFALDLSFLSLSVELDRAWMIRYAKNGNTQVP